jgi:DNA-binding IclR family transcriptional regulator
MLGEDTGRTLKTTRTSLQVLELVLEYDGLTLAELDELVDKPKTSLHGHLTTLRDCRYLITDGHTYRGSCRLALLGEQAKHSNRAVPIAADVVEQLSAQTGLEANFTVLEHGRLLLVHGTPGESADDATGGFRTEYYLHNTAAGKAILAEMDREYVELVVDEWGLPSETDATITDRERLFETLSATAERGYGVVDGESAPGVVAVGVPVHDADGAIVGGLSVGGPEHRVDTGWLHREVVDLLLEGVENLERDLAP